MAHFTFFFNSTKNANHNVKSSNCFFCPTNSPKPKDIDITQRKAANSHILELATSKLMINDSFHCQNSFVIFIFFKKFCPSTKTKPSE